MALNIKDAETEQLAAEVAALRERKARLTAARTATSRGQRLRQFLAEELWPQIPGEVLGTAMSKTEREQILGYGPEGV
jgi:antitoxin VapB